MTYVNEAEEAETRRSAAGGQEGISVMRAGEERRQSYLAMSKFNLFLKPRIKRENVAAQCTLAFQNHFKGFTRFVPWSELGD